MPENIRKWFEAYGKSHNTPPEFLFLGSLITCASIMGPDTCVEVRATYTEPVNLYGISVGFPGCGKSQAFRMTITEPLSALPDPFSTMLVDDYTKRGLHKHLQSDCGRALIAHEEMGAFFDLVQKRQTEGLGERQMYCRLDDAGHGRV